jgi:hypothetical protein
MQGNFRLKLPNSRKFKNLPFTSNTNSGKLIFEVKVGKIQNFHFLNFHNEPSLPAHLCHLLSHCSRPDKADKRGQLTLVEKRRF